MVKLLAGVRCKAIVYLFFLVFGGMDAHGAYLDISTTARQSGSRSSAQTTSTTLSIPEIIRRLSSLAADPPVYQGDETTKE